MPNWAGCPPRDTLLFLLCWQCFPPSSHTLSGQHFDQSWNSSYISKSWASRPLLLVVWKSTIDGGWKRVLCCCNKISQIGKFLKKKNSVIVLESGWSIRRWGGGIVLSGSSCSRSPWWAKRRHNVLSMQKSKRKGLEKKRRHTHPFIRDLFLWQQYDPSWGHSPQGLRTS